MIIFGCSLQNIFSAGSQRDVEIHNLKWRDAKGGSMTLARPIIKGQEASKLEKLMQEQPFLSTIFFQNSWQETENSPIQKPEMKVFFQKADTGLMHSQAKNVWYNRSGYVMGPDEYRGTRFETFYAIDKNGTILAKLNWYPGENFFAKDIFMMVDHKKVACLAWGIITNWYWPASDEKEWETESVFDDNCRGVNIDVIIYKKPKGISFSRLVSQATKEKKKRENAYLHLPAKRPHILGINEALNDSCIVRAFSSGGGLRVIRIEDGDDLVGYGEHPHVEEALEHADEDYLAGGRPYREVYGKLYPHYLTGETISTSNLDYWIRKGETFRSWKENDQIVFQLRGYSEREKIPAVIYNAVKKGLKIGWRDKRGFYHLCEPYIFANLEVGVSSQVVGKPHNGYANVKVPENILKVVLGHRYRIKQPVRWLSQGIYYETKVIAYPPFYYQSEYQKDHKPGNGYYIYDSEVVTRIVPKFEIDSSFYKICKTGYGEDFWSAMVAAFAAPETEDFEEKEKAYDDFDLREELLSL